MRPFIFLFLSGNFGYAAGIIISVFLLAYLVYALVKPEKF